METLTIFLILLGASSLSSENAEPKGPKPKPGQLFKGIYKNNYNPYQPSRPTTTAAPGKQLQSLDWKDIRFVDHDQAPSPDGTFHYSFKTDNGIYVTASGFPRRGFGPEEDRQEMQGYYSYTSPEGVPVVTQWYADETGFHAKITYND